MYKLSENVTYGLILVAVTFFLLVSIPKIFFPYEAHWMEGAMLAEVSWIINGHPLYMSPSISHVPSLYQPFYYYITAAITSITGLTFVTARLTSILATFFTLFIIYKIVKKETTKTFFAISSVGLYIAAFAKTEYGLLMARIDPLLTFLIVASVATIFYSRSYRILFFGAVLFTLSFFTKQSALVFIPSVSFYLLLVRGWKQSIFFSAAIIILGFSFIFFLNGIFDDWYTFYAFSIIASMTESARWGYAFNALFLYIILRCWPVCVALLIAPIKSLFIASERKKESPRIYFGLFFATGILAGFLGLANPGGGHNVLLPASAGCAIFLPLMVENMSSKARYTKIVRWIIPIQLLLLISYPWADSRNIVRQVDKDNYKQFYSYISTLPGEVWIPFHSFTAQFTGKRDYAGFDFAEGAILPNDFRAKNLRDQFDTAYTNKHWSYIVSDFKHKFPHYKLKDSVINLNKVRGSDDTNLYIYTPEE